MFTSSLATFGGELALGTVDDGTRQTPLTTYGATKAMLELLFADATRKGFLDARSARPPTVVVRPGRAQCGGLGLRQRRRARAARRAAGDPAGQPRPAGRRDRRRHDGRAAWRACSRSTATTSATAGRSTSPGLVVTPRELLDALHALVDPATLAPVTVEVDPATEAIVRTWATDWRSSRADALGLPRDEDAAGDRARLPERASADERRARRRCSTPARARTAPSSRTRSARRPPSTRSPARSSRSSGSSDSPAQLTLKCDPEHGEALRAEHAAIAPGYHMNKRHWITVTLDGSLAADADRGADRGLVRPRRAASARSLSAPYGFGVRPSSRARLME